jgi:hypothetical protein
MAQVVARGVGGGGMGPLNLLLSHNGAQWATILGMGAYIYNPEVFVKSIRNILLGNNDSFLLPSSSSHRETTASTSTTATPIIIHTSDGRHGTIGFAGASIVSTIIFYTMGAGCVWISYTLCTSVLPDYISELMPVTRKVFDQTTKNLATSLFNVKEAMIKQIQFVMSKQDELAVKQDDTHRDVKDIQEDMKFVRSDLSGVMEGVDRCEASVEASQRLQAYTARGVKLLVAAVATVLPRDENYQILRELEKYARDGEPFRNLIERSQQQQLQSPTVVASVLPPSQQQPLTINEPPENEHPRQQQQHPNPHYTSMYSNIPQKYNSSYTNHPQELHEPAKRNEYSNEIDFLAMIRDGTLVVQR